MGNKGRYSCIGMLKLEFKGFIYDFKECGYFFLGNRIKGQLGEWYLKF